MDVELKISKKSRELLKKMPELIVPAVFKGMTTAMMLAKRTAISPYLSGKALRHRSGRLLKSIDTDVKIQGDKVIGKIGTNVVYGRVHELGFKGPVRVGAHERTIRQAFGRPIAPTRISVGAHTRNVDIPARPFLRPALEDNLPKIRGILAKRIEEAFK